MKHLFALLSLALVAPAHAAVSIPSTPVRGINNATVSHACALTGVSAGDTIVFGFHDRSSGATVSGITDGDAGTYTQRSTLTIGASLYRMYVRENVSAPSGGNLTITLTSGASQNSQTVCAIVRSDAGGGVYPTFDQVATAVNGSTSTTAVSNTLSATAAGVLVGLFHSGSTQTVTPTVGDHASLTGETVAPATEAGARTFLVYAVNAASGTLGFTSGASAALTITNSAYGFHLINFIESGGAPSSGLLLRRRRT